MNITFHDKSFRDECNDQKRLIKHHGALRAKRIRQRLDDLLAADTLEIMRSFQAAAMSSQEIGKARYPWTSIIPGV